MTRTHARILWLPLAAALLAAGQARADGPPLSVPAATIEAALSCPAAFAEGRDPVLLIHGTAVSAEESWPWGFQQALAGLGYSVCTVNLPGRALGDIQTSAEYVVHAVRVIAAASGRHVDTIGHSQGGLQPRWAVKWWPDVQTSVDDLITLSSPHHGTAIIDVVCGGGGGCPPAVWQMKPGSAFLGALNAGDETPGTISYTSIYSATDELVQPQVPGSTSSLDGASNVLIQSLCPGRPAHHAATLYDAAAWAVALDALAHDGPADAARVGSEPCADDFMPGVDAHDAAAGNLLIYGNGVQSFSQASREPSEPPLKDYARG